MTAGADRSADQALRRALRSLFLSAAAMDGGFFLILVAMPFKVLHLGGGALELGLVAAIGALSYIIAAPLAGRRSDRGGRTLLCLIGGLLLIVTAVLAWLVQRLDLLLALQALMGLGKALYWPAVQATLGDLTSGPRRLPALSRFNLAWSGGKTLGFLLGGVLLGCCGFRTVYLTGAGAVAVAFLLLPRGALVDRARRAAANMATSDAPQGVGAEPDGVRLRLFRNMGWVANTAAAGAFGILTHHLPQWFVARDWDPDRYGWFLGAILAAQTISFVLLGGRLRLVWSVWRLWLPQVLCLAAVAAIPLVTGFVGLLVLTPVIGFACGVCYAASIYYSLEGPGRGRNAGIHEALVGAGGFLPPLVAGLFVRAGASLASPYLLAAAVLLLGLLVQAGLRLLAARSLPPTVS